MNSWESSVPKVSVAEEFCLEGFCFVIVNWLHVFFTVPTKPC